MGDRLRFIFNRINQRLWVRPFLACLLSIAGAFFAKVADNSGIQEIVPEIIPDSIETLLSIVATSMMVIATFAVASMVSAYASTSGTATPRAFSVVVADDVSQNALSTFIGAFIFSIVALIALQNSYYDKAGHFALFALTLLVLIIVIATFVRWVDRIARLGRMGATIDKVEAATAAALQRRRLAPTLHGAKIKTRQPKGQAIYANKSIGYVQRVDVDSLQKQAKKLKISITVAALPGTFCAPGRALAYVSTESANTSDINTSFIQEAFLIGDERLFDEDPRFGLIVLSEIASRALSPAVNDPGTAIDIIGTFVRLFVNWCEPVENDGTQTPKCDRISVPEIALSDMFDDAFTAVARDGAGTVEVAVRLQKAFHSLSMAGNPQMRDVAIHHSSLALARAEGALSFSKDLGVVRKAAKFASSV